MKLFDYSFLEDYPVSQKNYRNLRLLYITEERLSFWKETYPATLKKFSAVRIYKDILSTHDIEHIPADRDRTRALLDGTAEPRTEDEHKVLGQRDAILFCEELKTRKRLVPEDFLELHRRLMTRHDMNGGKYRSHDCPHNGYGTATTIQNPASKLEVKYVLSSFCKTYNDAFDDSSIDGLLLALCATLDFFSVSPFNNGNGRMYRLLLNLFLGRAGITVQTYVPLEKFILHHLDNHFKALESSTDGWAGNSEGYRFFIEDIIHNLGHCCIYINQSLPPISAGKLSKSERVGYIAMNAPSDFSIDYISERAPDVSSLSINNQLRDMIDMGMIEKIGNTRGTVYRVVRRGE